MAGDTRQSLAAPRRLQIYRLHAQAMNAARTGFSDITPVISALHQLDEKRPMRESGLGRKTAFIFWAEFHCAGTKDPHQHAIVAALPDVVHQPVESRSALAGAVVSVANILGYFQVQDAQLLLLVTSSL